MKKIVLALTILIFIIGCAQEREFGKRPEGQERHNPPQAIPELDKGKGINEPLTPQEKWPEETVFFSFHNSPIEIAPGEEKKIWYFMFVNLSEVKQVL